MSANVPSNGPIRQLDRRIEPETPLTEEEVQRPDRLVRILVDILRDVRALTRRWSARRLDFEGRVLDATGTTKTRLEHQFGGAVRFWIVDWNGAAAPNVRKDSDTDDNTLVITSTSAGTATIRVEESG